MSEQIPTLDPEALIETANRLFRRFTAGLAEGREQAALVLDVSPADVDVIREILEQLLERIHVAAVIQPARRGIVVRRKTEAD